MGGVRSSNVLIAVDREPDDRNRGNVDYRDIVLESVPHGFCVFDADLTIRLSNRRLRELFGMPESVTQVGASMYGLLRYSHEQGRLGGVGLDEAWRERLDLIAAGEPFTRFEHFSDGRVMSIAYRPADGGGWVAIHEDITAQHRLEDELRAQAARFGQALDTMSHGLAMFDQDNRLIVCNRRYVTTYGFDPAVVRPGISVFDILAHSLERGAHAGVTLAALHDDFRARLAALSNSRRLRQLPDGRWICTRAGPTPDGGWIFTCEDVTDREAAVQAVKAQHARFDAALNAIPQGLCMFDAHQRLIVCNQNYVRLFRADTAVVRPGITLWEIFDHGVRLGNYPGMTADELVARRMEAVSKADGGAYDQIMADGRIISVSIEILADGGWLGMFEDVTELRAADRERAAAIMAIQEQNMLLDATLETMAQGLCVFDADMRIVVRNRRYLDCFGLSDADAGPGVSVLDVITKSVGDGVHIPGKDAIRVYDEFTSGLSSSQDMVLQRHLANGRILAMRSRPMANGGWVVTYDDITDRERAASELREQHRRFDAALNNMAHGLCMLDEDLGLIVCNRRYLDMYGMSPDVVRPGVPMQTIVEHSIALGNYRDVTADQLVASYFDRLGRGEFLSHRQLADGRIFRVLYHPMAHGGWVAIHEDVTERRKAEEYIVHLAHHDSLTGLPNRVLFRERMAEGLEDLARTGEPLALLCLDLDHFKSVNDTLGHPVGDALLTIVARRLEAAVGEAGFVARLGGDEFAILLHGAGAARAEELARRLARVVSDRVVIDDHLINSGISIGIALAPQDASGGDHLMKCADLALYRAKFEGRGMFRFFEPDMSMRLQERRALELDLRQALQSDEFHLVFQPQVSSRDLGLLGFETLLRWNHPVRGPVPPSDFIPVAEETGLIGALGEWVLARACAAALHWPETVQVAVNLSPIQFKDRSLVSVVRRALRETGLAAHRLELEITEAVLLQNDGTTTAMLHELRGLGIRIAMDDFGIGYSSLSYLRSFPFDKIKIDRSFIADIEVNRDNAAIVRAMADLGTSLRIETTAEGIETAEQLAVARKCGCSQVQGYLISPPCPEPELHDLIARLQAVALPV